MATEYKRMQQLGGAYKDFDPAKMLAREIQVITSGDPASNTGRSIYICFAPGIVKRIVSYEDFETEMQNALEEIQESFTSEIQAVIVEADNAAQAANIAKDLANTAAARAEAAAENAEQTDVAQLVQKINTLQEYINTGPIVVSEEDIPVAQRKAGHWYFFVTESQSASGGEPSYDIVAGPNNMALKIVEED